MAVVAGGQVPHAPFNGLRARLRSVQLAPPRGELRLGARSLSFDGAQDEVGECGTVRRRRSVQPAFEIADAVVDERRAGCA
jgi:hypothetical protein